MCPMVLADVEAGVDFVSNPHALWNSPWVILPAMEPRKSSRIRFVQGRGPAFYTRCNFKGLMFSGKPEFTIEFENFSAPGGPHRIVLESTDAFIRCPQRYPWPICVMCNKFLYPADAHRSSHKHINARRWLESVNSKEDLIKIHQEKIGKLVMRHQSSAK